MEPSPPIAESPKFSRGELVAVGLLMLVAAVFLFNNLDAKYLWQDEAATAVLGGRLMKYGKPLSYDGVNLVTMDYFFPEDAATIDERTGDPAKSVEYHVRRGDFKADTTWIGQPWGSILVAGVSQTLFGRTTFAARGPFALASLLTVALLYGFVRREFRDPLLAGLAVAILIGNVYWIIHGRQCRYYAFSGMFLLLTLMAFVRWQRGRRLGGLLFVIAAWCWFQMDFGSFWPVVGILLLIAAGTKTWRAIVVGAALGAAVAPWVWYYELAGRMKQSFTPWAQKFCLNLFHVNQFLIPLVVLIVAGIFLYRHWRMLDPLVRQVLAASLAIIVSMLVWVPTVAPYGFHRYVVHLAPLASLGAAWGLTQVADWGVRRFGAGEGRARIAVLLTGFLVFCPWLSDVVALPLKTAVLPDASPVGPVIRFEWGVLREEVFSPNPDPNRLTVEALERLAAPGDEVLINYEDVPLMYYTDLRVRGGIPCFRVEDDSRGPPRFVVYRQRATFVLRDPYEREMQRHRWQPRRSEIPDVPWGNIPEPEFRIDMEPVTAPKAILLERRAQ